MASDQNQLKFTFSCLMYKDFSSYCKRIEKNHKWIFAIKLTFYKKKLSLFFAWFCKVAINWKLDDFNAFFILSQQQPHLVKKDCFSNNFSFWSFFLFITLLPHLFFSAAWNLQIIYCKSFTTYIFNYFSILKTHY